MDSRFAAESGDKKQEQELLAATYVLTGARYSRDLANKILKGASRNVFDIRESDTFQEIREIGLAKGIADVERLDEMLDRLLETESWDEFWQK